MSKKYVTLIFSDRKGIPSEKFQPTGYGGLRHNQFGYINKLPLLAKYLNRLAVLPPPWISLEHRHNFNRPVDKNNTWNKYFNLEKIDNLEMNNPFKYNNNGSIITNLSTSYYPSNTPLEEFDNTKDIIVLVNYHDTESTLKTYSYLRFNFKNKFIPNIKDKYSTSKLLKNYANLIISKMNLGKFTFIHVRRGDFLHNYILAPPKGTFPYTSPEFISNFIKSKTKNKNIIFATNEKDTLYKTKIINQLDNYNIIFEEAYFKYLPDNIINDNFCIYLISHEIARNADINIGTVGYVRLGDKYDYKLSNYQ